MPLNRVYEKIGNWACEAGCGYSCNLVSVETSTPFLKLTFQCPCCNAKMTRYYNIEKHGYVEALGVKCGNSVNERMFLESQPCAGMMNCPRAEFKRFFRRGIELEACIDEIATIVPRQCPGLSEGQLKHCFHKLFDIRNDWALEPRFQETYRHAERALVVIAEHGPAGAAPFGIE